MGDCLVSGINGLHWQMLSQVQTGILSLVQALTDRKIDREKEKKEITNLEWLSLVLM